MINHTSSEHPWFQSSREDPEGPYGDYYVWRDDDTGYPDARIIFVDTEDSNWTFDTVRKQFYWHRFYSHQPDLNYDNPKVLDEVLNALRFWLQLGVDGFRLDAVPYLVEEEGTNCENLEGTHAILKTIRSVLGPLVCLGQKQAAGELLVDVRRGALNRGREEVRVGRGEPGARHLRGPLHGGADSLPVELPPYGYVWLLFDDSHPPPLHASVADRRLVRGALTVAVDHSGHSRWHAGWVQSAHGT